MQDETVSNETNDDQDTPTEGAETPAVTDDAGKETEVKADAETKDADGEKPDAKDGDETKPKADPEPFELKIDLPEGYEVDEARLGGFKETITDFETELANANGDRGKIREVVNAMAGKLVASETAAIDAAAKAHSDRVDGWKADIRQDAEIGGARYDDSMSVIARARDQFGSDELQKVLDETGLGSHPAMARYFYRVGSSISESDPTGGAGASAPRDTPDKVLFG